MAKDKSRPGLLRSRASGFRTDRSANVAITFALASIPIVYLAGVGIDFTNAMETQSQLRAAADAAAIAAVTPAMMAESDANAIAAATAVFTAKVESMPKLSFDSKTLNITVQDAGLVRNVTVKWSAGSANNFPSLLSESYWPIGGTSVSSSTVMPNIDFYVLLDSSPSMAIAGTPAGITTMVNNTQSQGGCAFACHETHPQSDNLGNPHGEDNYTLARNLGVTLRIDLLTQATENLMSTAQQTQTANHNTYRAGIYTFDYNLHTIEPLTSNLGVAQTQASNIEVLEVYDNNCLTSSNCNSDQDTNFDTALGGINSTMPNPGGGTNTVGDTPQEVLFFVTDGVADYTNSSSCQEPTTGGRCQEPIDVSYCTSIKNRGIRIAVLYTEYLPLPTNSWYNSWIAPFQSTIGSNLQSCASPGLYFDVQSGGDISAAMTALFQQAVATARLTQ